MRKFVNDVSSVWIVEDQALWSDTLEATVLAVGPHIKVRTFDCLMEAEAAIDDAPGDQGPDVVFLDLFVPLNSGPNNGDSAIESEFLISKLARNFAAKPPQVYLLTGEEQYEQIVAAAKRGCTGFIGKSVLRGETATRSYVTLALLGAPLFTRGPMEIEGRGLIRREAEVLELIALMQTAKEIAKGLSLSDRTVEQYLSSAMTKIGVSKRTEAIDWVFSNLRVLESVLGRKINDALEMVTAITKTEAKVVQLIGAKMTSNEIAEALKLASVAAVDQHASRAQRKLGLDSRDACAAWSIKHTKLLTHMAS